MNYRKFGRLGWDISEVGYGTWGLGGGPGGWKGSTDQEVLESLSEAVKLGCNFFDTAWIYGRGHSEKLLGELIRRYDNRKLYIATKVPPMNRKWPADQDSGIEDVFPRDFVFEYLQKSLENLGVDCIDLFQFHVWQDHWVNDSGWKKTIEELRSKGLVKGIGISVNTWEPWNVLETLKTGLIDSVQVIYNVFEQQPDDELFPFCRQNNIGVIARVPFDEGSLSGDLTIDSRFDKDDWRSSYFVEENLAACIPRVEEIKRNLPGHLSMPQAALKFILTSQTVSTVIPGMRRLKNVHSNMAVSDMPPLEEDFTEYLKGCRWDREPCEWSQ